jgi:hypothetical protein
MTNDTKKRSTPEVIGDCIHWLVEAMGLNAFAHLYLTGVMLFAIFFPGSESRSLLWCGVCVSACFAIVHTIDNQILLRRKDHNQDKL